MTRTSIFWPETGHVKVAVRTINGGFGHLLLPAEMARRRPGNASDRGWFLQRRRGGLGHRRAPLRRRDEVHLFALLRNRRVLISWIFHVRLDLTVLQRVWIRLIGRQYVLLVDLLR